MIVRRALLAAVALFVMATPLAAQCLPTPLPPELVPACQARYPKWTGELASLGVNALLGGVSAGVVQELRGGSFRDAFFTGALGGSVIYVGKRVAAGEFDGAGFAGRQLAAVGGSVIRNAGASRGMLDELVLPVGLGRIYWDRARGDVSFRPDLTAIGWTLSGIQEKDLRFDWSESLSAGTPVFFADNRILIINDDSAHVGGLTNSGVIFLANVTAFGPDVARINAKHERVHVLQEDQVFLTITDPLEDHLMRRIPYIGDQLARRVDVNLATELFDVLSWRMPRYLDRPWETEAIFRAR